jgi:hypothetical protein
VHLIPDAPYIETIPVIILLREGLVMISPCCAPLLPWLFPRSPFYTQTHTKTLSPERKLRYLEKNGEKARKEMRIEDTEVVTWAQKEQPWEEMDGKS